MKDYKLKMKNCCGIVGANLRVRPYSGQPQGIVPTNASKIFIPAIGVAKIFHFSFYEI
jgi:hypothetical protein